MSASRPPVAPATEAPPRPLAVWSIDPTALDRLAAAAVERAAAQLHAEFAAMPVATGELVTPTEYARRIGMDKRAVRRLIATDPDFPAIDIAWWPGHDTPRFRIAVDAIPAWAAKRRAREWEAGQA